MKVIAAINANTFLVEATETEIAHILGFTYRGEEGCPKIAVGLTVDVRRIWEDLRAMQKVRQALQGAATQLRRAADLVDSADTFARVAEEEDKSDECDSSQGCGVPASG